MSPPWMPFYIADYRADTAHLSAAEHGAYLLLIMHYWQKGGLPDDDRQLARIACMAPDEWDDARPVVSSFFGPRWTHARIDAELAKASEKHSKRVDAGRRGGISKANREQNPSNASGNANSNALASSSQPQPDSTDANASDAIASDDDFPPDAFQVWYGEYPHKVGRSAAEKAFSRVRKAKAVSFDELMDGLRRYIRTKPPDRAWCNPATWLNQDRWADQPSNVEPLFQRGCPENAGKTRTVHDAAIALAEWVRDEDERGQRPMLQIGSG